MKSSLAFLVNLINSQKTHLNIEPRTIIKNSDNIFLFLAYQRPKSEKSRQNIFAAPEN
jgi:hypothetical protein